MEKINFKNATRFESIKGIVYNSVKLYGNKIAFVIKHKKGKAVEYENKTYKKLLEDINGFGTGLYNLGLCKKRIAVIGRNRYEWVIAHLANLLGGIISVPLDKELQINELEESLIRSKADAVVYDEKYENLINEIKQNGKTNIEKYICMSDESENLLFNDVMNKGKQLIKNGDNSFENYSVNPDEFSILLFTSGTTDKSKAVMLCQRGIAYNVYDMQLVEDFKTTDVNMAFLPFHHIFGSTGMIVMIACGIKTVFTDGLRYVKQNFKEYGVTLFVGVPIILDSLYKNILKEIKKQGKEQSVRRLRALSLFLMKLHIDVRRTLYKPILDQLGGKLRFVISGGAPLDADVAQGFNEMGIQIVQGYGLTETSPVISAESKDFTRRGSVGIPMRSTEVGIFNKDNEGMGEIRIKGKNVMLGYYENEQATNEVMNDGWFCTGDLGYIDKDGYLFITGRKKDMIVLKNGKKVFPEELETLINRIDRVKESYVYGVSADGLASEKIACKVVYDKSAFADDQEIYDILWNEIKSINQTLPMYKYIKGMSITEEPLIKTSTNKIKRKEEFKKINIGGE